MSLLYVDGVLVDSDWHAIVRNTYGDPVLRRCAPVWEPEYDRKVCVIEPRSGGTYNLFIPNIYWGLGLNDRSRVELSWFLVSKVAQKNHVPAAYLLALMVMN